jgi:hypothetical protein
MPALSLRRKWVEAPTKYDSDGLPLDGRSGLYLDGDAPKHVLFSEKTVMGWALTGTAHLDGDLLTLSFENGTIHYKITEREDDAWSATLAKEK